MRTHFYQLTAFALIVFSAGFSYAQNPPALANGLPAAAQNSVQDAQRQKPVNNLQDIIEKATHGIASQRAALGRLYYYGLSGVPQDYQEAYYWFSISDYELEGAEIEGQSGVNKKISELETEALLQGGFSPGRAETAILIDPEVRKMCKIFLVTLNQKLSEAQRHEIGQRVESWKAAHPRPTPPVRSAAEEKKLQMTRRLALEISSPDYLDPIYDVEGIKAIIAAGADVNLGKGLLGEAAKRGHLAMVQALVEGGGDVNISDLTGSTPLAYAAQKGHADVVKYLISKGAKVNVKDAKGDTPLARAVELGNADAVSALVEAQADLYARNHMEWTPLEAAAHAGKADTVRVLAKAGAKIPPVGTYPRPRYPSLIDQAMVDQLILSDKHDRPVWSPMAPAAKPEKPAVDHPANDATADAIGTLEKGTAEARNRMIEKIKAAPGSYAPPALAALSRALFSKFQDDEGVFWSIAATLRAAEDTKICPRKRYTSTYLGLSKVFEYYKRTAPEKLGLIAEKVAEWDRNTPADYNRQWGTSESTCLPKDQWAAAIDSVRKTAVSENFPGLQSIQAAPKKTSMDELLPRAERGDKAAQFELGICYTLESQCDTPVADLQRQLDHQASQELAQEGQSSKSYTPLDTKQERREKAVYWLDKSFDDWINKKSAARIMALLAVTSAYMSAPPVPGIKTDYKKACMLMLEMQKEKVFSLMPIAPWNPAAGSSIEHYAWQAVGHHALYPNQPFFYVPKDTKSKMSEEDVAKAKLRAEEYIREYLEASKPVCQQDKIEKYAP